MIYFDNSATTNTKPLSVKLATLKALSKKYCANPGRSSHKLSLNAENIVFETRERVKNFFNNDNLQNIIFTSGCTEALNMAIFGTLQKNGHVIYCSNSHNSVARPIEFLKSKKLISATLLETNSDGKITAEMVENEINDKTYLVVVNHTSNVTGATSDIEKIGEICKKHNLLFLVDGAQSAGHVKIDMQKNNISMLAVAGHKGLLCAQGIGLLIFRENIKIMPTKFGGTGTHSEALLPPVSYPESLEAGTGPTPLIFSLNAGLKYVEKNFDKINNRIEILTEFLLKELEKINQIKLYTSKTELNGVVSFTINNTETSDIVGFLNDNGICVRAGLHCAPLCHKRMGTLNGGTVRVSLSSFNKKREIKKLIKLLKKYIAIKFNK